MDLSDPLIARLAVPVAVTVIVSVLIRLIGGSGTRAAGVGLPAGAIAAYAVSPGWPIDPPTAPLAQVAWLMVAGALAGLVLDIAAKGQALTAVVAFLWPAVTLAVFLGFVLPAMGSATMIQVAEVAVVLGALLAWLHTIRDQGLSSPVTLGVISRAWSSGFRVRAWQRRGIRVQLGGGRAWLADLQLAEQALVVRVGGVDRMGRGRIWPRGPSRVEYRHQCAAGAAGRSRRGGRAGRSKLRSRKQLGAG